MKKVLSYFLHHDFSLPSWLEFFARSYLGYIMVINAPVGITIPLEDLALPEHAYQFIKSLWDTGYMMELTKGIELLVGLSYLTNRFVPLANVLLAPVLINIFGLGFNILPGAWMHTYQYLLILGFLAYRNRSAYRGLFQNRRSALHQSSAGVAA